MFISQSNKTTFFIVHLNIKISQLRAYFLTNLKTNQLKNKQLFL